MVQISSLCEELETLNYRLIRLVVSELRMSGPDRQTKKSAGLHRGGDRANQTESLITTGNRILAIAYDLGEALTHRDIQGVKEYVFQLAASKRRCDEAGIALNGMLAIVRKTRKRRRKCT